MTSLPLVGLPRRPCQQKHLHANVQLLAIYALITTILSKACKASGAEASQRTVRNVQFPLASDLPGLGNWIPTDYKNTKHECFPESERELQTDPISRAVPGLLTRHDSTLIFGRDGYISLFHGPLMNIRATESGHKRNNNSIGHYEPNSII